MTDVDTFAVQLVLGLADELAGSDEDGGAAIDTAYWDAASRVHAVAVALSPLIERAKTEAAAEALHEAACTLAALPRVPLDAAEYLRDRAASLRATQADGTTT